MATLTRTTFGQHLAAARIKAGITSRRQLASRLGVSKTAVSYWENDETLPSAESMYQLARVLDVATSTVGRWLDDSPLLNATLTTSASNSENPGYLNSLRLSVFPTARTVGALRPAAA